MILNRIFIYSFGSEFIVELRIGNTGLYEETFSVSLSVFGVRIICANFSASGKCNKWRLAYKRMLMNLIVYDGNSLSTFS